MVIMANWRQDEYPATDEVQCIKIYIPAGDEFKAVAAALLAKPTDVLNYVDPFSVQAEGLADVWDSAYAQIDWNGCGPVITQTSSEVNLWGHDAVVQGGGSALSRAVLATQFHNFIVQPTTPALNWKVRWDRYLDAGAWSYAWLWNRNTNCGIIDVYATPTSGGTVVVINDLDMRGSSLPNQRTTGAFNLSVGELYAIEMEVVGTSLGSNYNAQFTLLQLWRTGD